MEVSGDRVVFRYPVGLMVAYVMSLNDYHAVLSLARTMEQRYQVMQAVKEMDPDVDPEVGDRLRKEFEELKK